MTAATRPNYAGLRDWFRSRESGTQIGIYDADAQGLDPESGRYAVVCEDHGYTVNVDTLAMARDAGRHPGWNFCQVCQEAADEDSRS